MVKKSASSAGESKIDFQSQTRPCSTRHHPENFPTLSDSPQNVHPSLLGINRLKTIRPHRFIDHLKKISPPNDCPLVPGSCDETA
jgi:hypothetical protein